MMEEGQIIGDEIHPFNDADVVRDIIQEMSQS